MTFSRSYNSRCYNVHQTVDKTVDENWLDVLIFLKSQSIGSRNTFIEIMVNIMRIS